MQSNLCGCTQVHRQESFPWSTFLPYPMLSLFDEVFSLSLLSQEPYSQKKCQNPYSLKAFRSTEYKHRCWWQCRQIILTYGWPIKPKRWWWKWFQWFWWCLILYRIFKNFNRKSTEFSHSNIETKIMLDLGLRSMPLPKLLHDLPSTGYQARFHQLVF